MTPPGTPPALAQKIRDAAAEALAMADVQQKVIALGGEVSGGTPGELAAFMKAERVRWRKVIVEAGVTVD